jgi:predicted nucleotide-binding protein
VDIASANAVVDHLSESYLQPISTSTNETAYQIALRGLLVSGWGSNAVRIVADVLALLRILHGEDPAFRRYSWRALRTHARLPHKALNLVYTTVGLAQLSTGRGLFADADERWWTAPKDVDVILEYSSATDYLRTLIPAPKRTVAVVPSSSGLAPEKPMPMDNARSIERKAVASRPRIIVGSSVEGLKAAKAVQKNLHYFAECTLWTQAFGLSSTTIETIDSWRNDKYDFAVLVLTPDDALEKREASGLAPRDNVIFELGFFVGAFGRSRTFVIHPRDKSLLLPSDLQGVTVATYVLHSDGNLGAALGAACTQVEEAVEKLHEEGSSSD